MPLANRLFRRWDSSDPGRAPPPLPLNPNPSSPIVARPQSTAPAIAAAAQAIADRARDSVITPSTFASSALSNAMPDSKSPERSLVKGATHRRLQSLQTNSVKDLRSYLDGARSASPERSSRNTTPSPSKDDLRKDLPSNERARSRSATPTPVRPSRSSSIRPILGENTPPSATMLALQTIPTKDFPEVALSDISNSSTGRPSTSVEGLSTQILSLTTICTSLQREMQTLSRRSKDNATDLISLKEATKFRDEDLRKGLKDLKEKMNDKAVAPRSDSILASPSSGSKSVNLPRIPSPGSLYEDFRSGSPNPYSIEGAASVAMLEKIIREMVTKEGQERLLSTLSKLFDKAQQESGQTANKVAELVQFIKSSPKSQALISPGTPATIEAPKSSALTKTVRSMEPSIAMGYADQNGNAKPYNSPKAADFVSDEIIKLLKKIKDSCGSTASMLGNVNAEQHNLKGQILGMGRELAEKIDASRKAATGAKAIEDGSGKQDIARIIQEGLADLKVHLENTMREKRRQSNSSNLSRSTVDNREVYDVVKRSMAQNQLSGRSTYASAQQQTQGIDKEASISAVREAYEQYKPEFEIQQYGLERDEILQCLKQGLDEYHGKSAPANGMTREEIHQAIHEAMANFHPPPPMNDAHEIREEVLSAFRECLDEYKDLPRGGFNGSALSDRELDVTREVVLDAVRAALASHGPGAPKELEISREDLFEAVKAGLEASGTPFGRYGEQVVHLINGLVQDMRAEFKAYSSAGGRDTEQVLDAMKDGLESLRAEIEQYVDRAQDVTGKDEIIDTVRGGLEGLRRDVEMYCSQGPTDRSIGGRDMMQYMKSEFEHLHRTVASLDGSRGSTRDIGDSGAIMSALRAGFENLRSGVGSRGLDDDEVQEALKTEFEQLRETILSCHDVHKSEIIENMQSGFARLYEKVEGGGSYMSEGSASSVRAIKEELEHMKDMIASSMTISNRSHENDDFKDELIETVRNTSDAAGKTFLAEMQSEFEHLRSAIGSSIIRSGSDDQKDELLETIRNATDSLQKAAERNGGPVDNALLEALRGEFEVLRNTVQSTASRSASKADSEEIMEAIRLGLDDLRSHLEKKIDNPDRFNSATSDMLDALNDGLESLKTDLVKKLDCPFDMTALHEMQDSLKKGLEDLRRGRKGSTSEQQLSRGNEIVLVDEDDTSSRKVATKHVPKPASADMEKLEVMLAQLQIKVDSLDQNIQNPVFPPQQSQAESTVVKDDLTSIEETIKDLQARMTYLGDKLDPDVMAKKEDTDAIETILRNTKARLEELELPDPATSVNTRHVEALENLVKTTHDAVDELSNRVDESNASSKADVSVLQAMVGQLKSSIESISEHIAPKDAETELNKTDIDAIGVLCLEIKEKLGAFNDLPTRENMPSRSDVEQLMGLIHDFRDSHEKLKDSYETDISITAKAFDERKQEADAIVTGLGLIKSQLGEVGDELKTRLESGATDVSDLKENVKGLEETIASNFSISSDVKELMEIINREFERVHGAMDDVKMDQEQKATGIDEKHDSLKASVIEGVGAKLDDKFDVIMSKYDDAQHATESQVKIMEERAFEQQQIMDTTREVANELKISLDTLGTTVTGMENSFQEIADKISGDSQTVYERMDEGFQRLHDIHTHSAAIDEHRITREEISKAAGHLETLQSDFTEYHPKFIVRLEEIIALVNQHFEHSQKSQEESKEQARIASEESRHLNEELKSALPTLLPLPPPPSTSIETTSKYDESQVHEKLDKLMEHMNSSKDASTTLERLDEIHQKVMATAAEVSNFINTQTRLITEGHESQKQEAEEMSRVLERRLVDKQHVESDIINLQSEKESLLATVNELKAEREALISQKSRLTGDLSSLQTALDIRREELHEMDARADTLERKIVERIMDHSRMLMRANGSHPHSQAPNTSPAKNRDSAASTSTLGPLPSSPASKGINLALRPRPAAHSGAPTARRILSLNQISANAPTGAHGFASRAAGARSPALARSQSVRNGGVRARGAGAVRDALWGASAKRNVSTPVRGGAADDDKENDSSLHEIGESADEAESEREVECLSEAGTTVRTSLSRSETEGSLAYGTGSEDGSMSDGRSSVGTVTADRDSIGTGSYITGSDLSYSKRSTSYGSSARSVLGAETQLSEETADGEGEESDGEARSVHEDVPAAITAAKQDVEEHQDLENHQFALLDTSMDTKQMVVYPAPSDSGLGSDLPTAVMSGSEIDYFRRAAEETA